MADSRRIEELEKLLQEAELRAEKEKRRADASEEQTSATTLYEYIAACHHLVSSKFVVERDRALTSKGSITNPRHKLCPTNLRPWPNFIEQQRIASGVLHDAFSESARLFESRNFLSGLGYVAAAIPVCIAVVLLIQVFYLRSSRQMRLLDIEAKEPLFSHMIETINAASCIRAYGWSDGYIVLNRRILNASQKPYYLLKCIQKWLSLVLDLLVAGIAVLLVAVATNFEEQSTGLLGAALFSIISFSSGLQNLVREWTDLEMVVGAIARIRGYVKDTPSEDRPADTRVAPETWPNFGAIVWTNVSAEYDVATPALQDISLSIQPGEKIAICGRTGSGKTTLLSSLLRTIEITSGHITIDDVDICTLHRQQVRERISTVTQEPLFLYGTVRDNLDPFHSVTDERMAHVLQQTGLWTLIQSQGGLNEPISEDWFSDGQRQLFCLARAIARPQNILLLDEATSSMDPESDKLMQKVIRSESRGRTVLAVAHRLETVLDFDRVVLLDGGKVIEQGRPKELLTSGKSAFSALYHDTHLYAEHTEPNMPDS